ncbi:MAG: 50S ribosomal protein L30 [Clostridia bacterium]
MPNKKTDNKKVKITLVKSLIGRQDDQIATAISLGLRKINDVTIQTANDATLGKINKITHLVVAQEVE